MLARLPHRVEMLPAFDREGHYGRGDMVRPFADAAAQLENPGDLSPVVETPFGYHVIVLVAREPALEAPEESVRAAVRTELLWRLRHRALERYLDALRTRYNTHVRDDAMRAVERVPLGERGP
nr:SurA N-terminal domain protein [uncultured bacterium]